jgi:DNA-binding MarR family transcriptional regulator
MSGNPPISELTSHLGYWLRIVSNHVSLDFARRLDRAGVTVAEWVLLRQIYDLTADAPSRIAERMGMTRGAVTKLADKLIAKDYLQRRADETDGRAQVLTLTRNGRNLVPKLAEIADANDAAAFGHLRRAERAALERTLKGIVQHLGLNEVPVD